MKNLIWALVVLVSTNQLVCYAADAKVSPTSNLEIALHDLVSIQGFSCQFEQVLSYAEGGERVYTGKLAVLRPGKFRWQYIKPYVQLYVGNGDGIWLYEPDLMQVQYLQDLGGVEPVVMQLLDGRIGIKDMDVLSSEAISNDETSWYVRIGKNNQAVNIYLGIKDQALAWIESRDVLGNRNRLHLLQVKKESPALHLFQFKVPEGVDVVGALP